MKTKKFILAALTMVCAFVVTNLFTACSSSDDGLSNYAAYTVNPSGEVTGNCLAICEMMRSELQKGMTWENGVCKRDDAKAISICDGVYKSTIATASFKIVLYVTPFGNGVNNTSTTLKTYEY